ncbi:hypothetical protein D9611_003557 [Ephemerocybe angulata]|uniref:Ketoreductase (KR) domain-containing protein n=1 Tax=Ephemerocybe angulata TaxID=980116 RepID=A0A8H5B6S7_9AGAR|nr:hypothetical protein D9611_003557 [Tulosesus angulatus]
MVLTILNRIYNSSYFPHAYIPHIVIGIVAVVVLHALTQGRRTSRDRDLHARTVLLTGAFSSSLGITLLQELAKRGAHVVCLTEKKLDDPRVTIMVSLVRAATGNENIWAEQCNLEDLTSVRGFCTRFLTGDAGADGMSKEEKERQKEALPPGASAPADQRLDAIVFAHEYKHIGFFWGSGAEDEKSRERLSLGSFLMTTMLLPALLVAPVERDIRIVNVVNPFYAAAAGPGFTDPSFKPRSGSTFLLEGTRSLRSIILTRHLQRILDALPSPQAPPTNATDASGGVRVVSSKVQKSNIVAVSVSPGVSKVDTVAPLIGAVWGASDGERVERRSALGIILYILLQPLLRIFTKSPTSSIQSILHALFLPTPFKSLALGIAEAEALAEAEAAAEKAKKEGKDPVPEEKPKTLKKPVFKEVLKPGALYSECAVVQLRVPTQGKDVEKAEEKKGDSKEGRKKGVKEREKAQDAGKEAVDGPIELEDDGEYGGEDVGRRVWEAYEGALKLWEASVSKAAGSGKEKGKEAKQ